MLLDLHVEDGYIPQQGDVVRFHNGHYEWTVTKAIPYINTVYVESLIGKKKGVQSITNIIAIHRDTNFRPEKDHTLEYEDWTDRP